jgi:hypothetical protein
MMDWGSTGGFMWVGMLISRGEVDRETFLAIRADLERDRG